ncbi:AzlD domain-containing protein, partial [Mycobacterium tuberculosis]|nr:AzlD domain-containing protein [Mycobacterium tuberculosis]
EQGRLGAAFRALPVAVLSAIVAPTVLVTGWLESLAALVTIAAAIRLPLITTVALGVGAAAGLRALF